MTPPKFAYMCGVDYQHHIGEDAEPVKMYATAECVKKYRPCWSECGIVKIAVTCVQWVETQDFKPKASRD